MGVYSGPEIVKDGLVLHLDAATNKSFRGEPTVNFITNGHFSNGDGVPQEDGSNPTNTIIFLPKNPGNSDYVLEQTMGVASTEYQINLTTELKPNTTYVLSGWYAESNDYVGSSRMFHSRAFSTSGSHASLGIGIGTILEQKIINNILWKYCYNTITTPADYSNLFHWYVGYANENYSGKRYYTNLQIEEGNFPKWFVNGTRGTTVATGGGWADLSGNTNHGELVNGPTFNSDNLGSLVFDGVGNYINCGNSNISSIFNNSVNSNFTIMCWIKPNNIGTDQALVSQRHGDAMSLFLMSNGKITLEMDDTQNYSGTNFIFENNNWYCVAITYYNNTSSSFCEYYINGILDKNENKWDGNGIDFNNNLWIGWQSRTNYPRNPGHFFGNISQVQIYNRALSPSEIRQNFYATRGRYGV